MQVYEIATSELDGVTSQFAEETKLCALAFGELKLTGEYCEPAAVKPDLTVDKWTDVRGDRPNGRHRPRFTPNVLRPLRNSWNERQSRDPLHV